MQRKVRLAILEDHQSIIDGYLYRLRDNPRIEVVATLTYGEQLEKLPAHKPPPDVIILDVSVPTSEDNANPYPILHAIPRLLQKLPDLDVVVISVLADRGLIRAVAEAGVSGYILKDDQALIRDLGSVIQSVADGGICFSERTHHALLAGDSSPIKERLSPRQLEALSLSATYPNQTTGELARLMRVSSSTLRNLMSSAYLRLGVRTRAAAVEKARDLGLITKRVLSQQSGAAQR